MIRNFSYWQQVVSGGGTSYNFSDYSNPSNFSTCKTTIRNYITSQSLSNIGPDTQIILQYLVNRLTTVTPDLLNTKNWSPYGLTSVHYDLIYPTKNPDPVVPTGANEVTFEILDYTTSALVANGTVIFLENDGASESYIEIDFIISQVI